jgi:selenocysteine lyase/cysteine desulfurase
MVGTAAAIDFLASLGDGATRRARLKAAFAMLHARGQQLGERLWSGLREIPEVTVYGPPPHEPRTPTISFVVRGVASEDVARALAERAVFVSHGDFYATTAVARLGHAKDGVVRAGCVCYTTADEVDRLLEGIRAVARGSA